MHIQSQPNSFRPVTVRPTSGARPNPGSPDAFQASWRPDDLMPDRYIQSGGGRQALQLAGIGVMFGGIIASTNLPSGWVGVGIIGSMCAGLALMSLANP